MDVLAEKPQKHPLQLTPPVSKHQFPDGIDSGRVPLLQGWLTPGPTVAGLPEGKELKLMGCYYYYCGPKTSIGAITCQTQCM